jgi:hypothetical protein
LLYNADIYHGDKEKTKENNKNSNLKTQFYHSGAEDIKGIFYHRGTESTE